MPPKILSLGGVNMKRVIFLLTYSVGICSLWIASPLTAEERADFSADEVYPHSSKLMWPSSDLSIHQHRGTPVTCWLADQHICAEDSCQDTATRL